MDNYQRIKEMDRDEMAKFMFDMVDCVSCTGKLQIKPDCSGDGTKCLSIIKKWLKEKPMTVKERMKKKFQQKYLYFISYGCTGGFGNSRCYLDFEIKTSDDIDKVTKLLKVWNPEVQGIVVLNYIKMDEEIEEEV